MRAGLVPGRHRPGRRGRGGAILHAARAGAAATPARPLHYRSLDRANKRPRLFRHAGVDFGASAGTPVIAAADGRAVQLIDWGPGCGLGVILEHPEFKRYTAYCHMQEVLVRTGEEISRGRIIGRVGTSGNAVGVPHVHFDCARPRATPTRRRPWGTADPMKIAAGCFDAKRSYPWFACSHLPHPCGGRLP